MAEGSSVAKLREVMEGMKKMTADVKEKGEKLRELAGQADEENESFRDEVEKRHEWAVRRKQRNMEAQKAAEKVAEAPADEEAGLVDGDIPSTGRNLHSTEPGRDSGFGGSADVFFDEPSVERQPSLAKRPMTLPPRAGSSSQAGDAEPAENLWTQEDQEDVEPEDVVRDAPQQEEAPEDEEAEQPEEMSEASPRRSARESTASTRRDVSLPAAESPTKKRKPKLMKSSDLPPADFSLLSLLDSGVTGDEDMELLGTETDS